MAKTARESQTQQVQVLTQSAMNGYGRLFGGQLMQWIDVVAAVTARRHSGRNVTTASVSDLRFRGAARANDTLVIIGRVVFVGRSSMEIRVDSYVEALGGARTLVNTAYVVMVALDENEHSVPVEELLPETQEDRAEWEAARARYIARAQERAREASEGGQNKCN